MDEAIATEAGTWEPSVAVDFARVRCAYICSILREEADMAPQSLLDNSMQSPRDPAESGEINWPQLQGCQVRQDQAEVWEAFDAAYRAQDSFVELGRKSAQRHGCFCQLSSEAMLTRGPPDRTAGRCTAPVFIPFPADARVSTSASLQGSLHSSDGATGRERNEPTAWGYGTKFENVPISR